MRRSIKVAQMVRVGIKVLYFFFTSAFLVLSWESLSLFPSCCAFYNALGRVESFLDQIIKGFTHALRIASKKRRKKDFFQT